MRFINEHNKPIEDIKAANHFWIYNIVDHDFYLNTPMFYHELRTDAYVLEISKNKIIVPSTYFIVIADFDGRLDNISSDEIVGREFQAFVFNTLLDYDSWRLEDIKVVDFIPEHEFVLPNISTPFPVAISDTHAIMLSEKDVYTRLKNMTFSDII